MYPEVFVNLIGTVTISPGSPVEVSIANVGIPLFVPVFLLIATSPLLYAKTVQDLPNDTFGVNAVKIDILSINVESDSQYLYMTCTFASSVFETDTGDAFDLFGYIDLDVDQDSTTGTTALSDFYNGSSEIGMDYYLELMVEDLAEIPEANSEFSEMVVTREQIASQISEGEVLQLVIWIVFG